VSLFTRLTMAVALILVTTSCIGAGRTRSLPVSNPARTQPAEPQDLTRRLYRPLHKGYIDFASGLYVREDDDLILLAGPSPVRLRRTYLSRDRVSRHFGIGTTHSGEWYLIGNPERLTWVQLILASGSRIHFDRVSEGTSMAGARFRHTATVGMFFESTLEWTGSVWLMRFNDGSEALFRDCGPADGDICSIIEQRPAEGQVVLYKRNPSGRLLAIESGDQAIMFEYDDRGRIVEARDTAGERVQYTYDEEGRLSRVTASDGTVRTYTYSLRHEMLTIREPTWFIENWFDEAGRCIKQTTHLADSNEPFTLMFAYSKVDEAGTQTDVTEYDGTRSSYQFDENRETLSVTYDADSVAPVTVKYDRHPATKAVTGMTITCGPTGETTRSVRAPIISADQLPNNRNMIRRRCAVER
jgi:YD repeat-containing protein